MDVGVLEEENAFPSGGRRRAVLDAHPTTCEIIVFGVDCALRIFNPKTSGPLCEVQRLSPRVLPHAFLEKTPGFWHQSAEAQAQLVLSALDDQHLKVPYEVVETRLNGGSSLLALVGTHCVSVVVLPAVSGCQTVLDATVNEVSDLLEQLGLEAYKEKFREAGYDNVLQLYQLSASEREQLRREVNLKPGHAHALAMHLDGRLPAMQQKKSLSAQVPSKPCWALPVQLSPVPLSSAASSSETTGDVRGGIGLGNHSPSSAAFSKLYRRDVSQIFARLDRGVQVQVVQAEWHPLSDSHLAVLLSDGSFHLYNILVDATTPELTLTVPAGSKQKPTRRDGVVAAQQSAATSSFTFGCPAQRGWASLAVHFVRPAGCLFVACPVLPRSARARRHLALQKDTLLSPSTSAEARRWVQQQCEDKLPPRETHGRPVRSKGLQAHPAPLVQGPFTVRDAAGEPVQVDAEAKALTVCALPLSGCAMLAVGWSDHALRFVLVASEPQPTWTGTEARTDPELLELSEARLLATAHPSDAEGPSPNGAEQMLWMRITLDAIRPSRLFVHGSGGDIFLVHAPWVAEWADYLQPASDPSAKPVTPPAAPPRSFDALQLLPRPGMPLADGDFEDEAMRDQYGLGSNWRRAAGVVGVASVYDPCLGEALFVMRNNGRCSRLQLENLPRKLVSAEGKAASTAAPQAKDEVLQTYEQQLKVLTHHRKRKEGKVKDRDDAEWKQLMAQVGASSPADRLSSCERALEFLAGRDSPLRTAMLVAAETKQRIARLEREAAEQPAVERKCLEEAKALDTTLHALHHKALFSAALQRNLELRSQALRRVLQCPGMWPAGELSAKEREHHRQLTGLRDQFWELKRNVECLSRRVVAGEYTGAEEAVAQTTSTRWDEPCTIAKEFVDDIITTEETEELTQELARQTSVVRQLVASLTDTLAKGDSIAAALEDLPY